MKPLPFSATEAEEKRGVPMYRQEETDLIVADSFDELTYRQKKLFLAACNRRIADNNKYSEELMKNLGGGVYNKITGKFSDAAYRSKVLKELARQKIVCVTFRSEAYPEPLRNIPSPPLVLYCRGDLSLLNEPCFAVVGSRRTLPSVIAACKHFSARLAAPFVVVTGVAEGADSAAIEGALDTGRVICVLSGGFNRLYPATNADLIGKVEKRGLVVTEYTPDTETRKYSFSMRNRIIAGLSRGTLVVSAAKKSGALITADYAVEFGREVFAFPYSPGILSGEGCNALIKNGATLTDDILDIFSVFGLKCETEAASPLTQDERKILKILRECGRVHIDRLCEKTGKLSYEVAVVCSSLEIKGLAVRSGGNTFAPVGQKE